MDSGHQYDTDYKNALMDQTDIRTKRRQQIIQVVIDELYLNISLRIWKSYNYNIFNINQKTSYHKINDAFIWLNSLIFDIPESPFYPLISKDLSPSILPIKRHINIVDMILDISILSIDTIRFYIYKAKRDPYYADFGYIILNKINQFIEKYWKKKKTRVLQIRINMIQNRLSDIESDKVRRLIAEKLSLYFADYINVCNKTNSDVLPPNRSYNHKIKFKNPSKSFQNISSLYQISMEYL